MLKSESALDTSSIPRANAVKLYTATVRVFGALMMAIHRIIFRLDFEPKYSMINRSGDILEIIANARKGDKNVLFGEVGHEALNNRAIGKSTTDEHFVSIVVEPTHIAVDLEFASGVPAKLIMSHENVSACVAVVDAIAKLFEIRKIGRLGLRIFYFDKKFNSRETSLGAFKKILDGNFTNIVTEDLGAISDFGIYLIGEHEDKLGYRFHCGPYLEGEAAKYVNNFASIIGRENEYDFVVDLDLFEANFTMINNLLSKWLAQSLNRGDATISRVARKLIPSEPKEGTLSNSIRGEELILGGSNGV